MRFCDGNPVLVSTDNVTFIQPADEQTLISFVGGSTLVVEDSFDAVAETMNPERQAAEPC